MLPQKGTILDIGSGKGIFTSYLALSGKDREVIGIDNHHEKTAIANQKTTGVSNLSFIDEDINNVAFNTYDAIVAMDFFHHVSWDIQENILKTCFKALKKGGFLLIKEIDSTPGMRYYSSWIADRTLYPRDKIYFRSSKEWAAVLEKTGFELKVLPSHTGFGSTIIYICHKN